MPSMGADDSELTELAGVADADTMAAYAWSLDDGADELPPPSRRAAVITAAAVVVSVSLAAVTVALGLRHLDRAPAPAPIEVAAAPTTTTIVSTTPAAAPPPPPPPVTVTTVVVQEPAPPPAARPPIPALTVADYDARYLAELQRRGVVVTNPGIATHDAHLVCAALQKGTPQAEVDQAYAQETGQTIFAAHAITTLAMLVYPNCP
ncbi:hypothetical protein SEA_PHAYONCE_31 [Mycobacterium phage Phayonce]|uniref:DUF732 domain-containing protein n=1 Tax=Mycobacterium phage Phayonce TaxID=1647302 RepID=A0A0F6WDW2_9CAUD|nr:hypothetical protein SEA_PHAYONCE_31 [Mycobacterium phage Phayonce]AKF14391.1 hypothetical protein SEA_PHAYONCE_31 [Mycobacterium phage Phayonce]